MGAFGEGLVQGAQAATQMKTQRENLKLQQDYYAAMGKKMDLEQKMMQSQFQGQQDLVKGLFKPPDKQMTDLQGPGAPTPLGLGEADQFLQTLSPQDMANGRSMQEIRERGPGMYKEGPRPQHMAPVPGTGGMWSGMSPELQSVAQSMLASTGGDMNKTMSTLAMLAPGAFPQAPKFQEHDPTKALLQMNGPGGMPTTAIAAQSKPAEEKLFPGDKPLVNQKGQAVYTPPPGVQTPDYMNVPHGTTVLDKRTNQPVFSAPEAPEKPEKPPAPTIKEVQTPDGTQFMQVSPQGVTPIGQPIKTAPAAPKAVDTENAIAMEMFGTDYASLAQPARAEVNKRIQTDKLALYKEQANVMVAAAGEKEKQKLAIPDKLSGPETDKVIMGKNTLDQLNEVANLYDPSLVGPAAGAMPSLRAGIPENWGGLSPKQARLYAAISTFQNRLTNLISGAAVSPDEAVRLQAEMPQPNQDPAVFEQRWAASWRNAQRLAETQRQTYGETGRDISGLSALPGPHQRFNNNFTENIIPQPKPPRAKPGEKGMAGAPPPPAHIPASQHKAWYDGWNDILSRSQPGGMQ